VVSFGHTEDGERPLAPEAAYVRESDRTRNGLEHPTGRRGTGGRGGARDCHICSSDVGTAIAVRLDRHLRRRIAFFGGHVPAPSRI